MATVQEIFTGFRKETADVIMVVGVIGILVTMILPVPPVLLDLLLALNIAMAIIVLITTMYSLNPLDFSIFPPMLLLLTLFRLSVNVASTRLILLRGGEGAGAAGSIIMAFGNFVVGGNYVVGLVIFVILVIVNFKVITAGSGRIAEVAARFTLDAMPGKQMAIDADLNAGIIDELEAKERRTEIAKEAEFYGAMDGASKFVKGDAVAGIIITGINITGGFIIGVFQQDMSMIDAAGTYTLLTIGDGLVSQIPALIISTAAGILVSRSGTGQKMGEEFAKHILQSDMPIYIGSVIVFLFGFVPGLPAFPFMTLGIGLAGSVYFFGERAEAEEAVVAAEEAAAADAETETGPEDVEHLLSLDNMELEVGYGLIPLVDKGQEGALLGRIRAIRRQFAGELGVVVPPIHIRDNLKLKPSEYRLLIKGIDVAGGELMVNHLLAMDPGDITQQIEGIPTTEPAFNLPALWIPPDKEEDAKFAGYTVVDNSTVIATHLTEIIRSNTAELLGRQEVQHLLDNLAKTSPKVVEELVPGVLPLGLVQKVLQNLLRERISIRNLLSIVETLADYGTLSKDPDLLTEYVRQKIARSIIGNAIQPDGSLPVVGVTQDLEDVIGGSIQQTDNGSFLSLDPHIAEKIIDAVRGEVEKNMAMNLQPVFLCSPNIRRHFRRLVEQYVPSAMVISHAEITPNVSIKAVGKVSINDG